MDQIYQTGPYPNPDREHIPPDQGGKRCNLHYKLLVN